MLFPTVERLEDGGPSFFPKATEQGHSSSSEGEKECASPEWDVPFLPNSIRKSRPKPISDIAFRPVSDESNKLLFSCTLHTAADSLQQISIQTINADPFLKQSATAGTCSPPPTSPSLLPRGTYSSVVSSNRYPLIHEDCRLVLPLAV